LFSEQTQHAAEKLKESIWPRFVHARHTFSCLLTEYRNVCLPEGILHSLEM